MNFDKLGWIVAAGLVGGLVGMGFQGAAPKFANVDLEKVFSEADLTKKNNDQLHQAQRTRQNVLQFIDEYPWMLNADAERYSILAVKEPMSATEKGEMDRITQDALAASNKQRDLSTKSNPTPEDLKLLNEYTTRDKQNKALLTRLSDTYGAELRDKEQTLRTASLEEVRKAVRELANKDGYTVVFSQDSAPFAANDLTSAALKNVKK